MIATHPIVTEKVPLMSYDNYYIELCRAIASELEEGSGKMIAHIRLYKAVGLIVDEIMQESLKGRISYKPAPRWRPMTRQEYELNRRYDFCARKGWDPRHVSGKAPRKRDNNINKIRRMR